MARCAAMVLTVLLGCPLLAHSGDMGVGEPRLLGGSLNVGTYFLVLYEVGAEVVIADRLAVGGKVIGLPTSETGGPSAEYLFVPSVRWRQRRSHNASVYLALAGTSIGEGGRAGTLGFGAERNLLDRVRLFVEVGAVALIGDGEEGMGGVAPYLLAGARLRLQTGRRIRPRPERVLFSALEPHDATKAQGFGFVAGDRREGLELVTRQGLEP